MTGGAADYSHDWRRTLLADVDLQPDSGEPVDPIGWPGYSGRQAVHWGRARLDGHDAVVAAWDFGVQGGSFGERDASAFLAAVDAACADHVPLVTLLRSGGIRLQEGMAALVGMPRATLGVRQLAEAGVPHITVADQPTTGGVWVTVGSRADVRAAVDGAVVGFAGPRVVEAVTGALPTKTGPAASHTAASAAEAGLVDALLGPHDVRGWIVHVLDQLSHSGERPPRTADPELEPGPDDGWEQVLACRGGARPDGAALLSALVPDGVPLDGADRSVAARVGRLAGMPVVAVALAADRGGAPSVAGYRLLQRCARLAGRLGLSLVTLVDTPGADAHPEQENAGMAAAIGDAMDAVLACPSPTLAVLHGEGGSGGALAAACTDRVLVSPAAYFAALGPEGAAVTLRRSAEEAMRLMAVLPADLLAMGLADAPTASLATVAGVGAFVDQVAARLHDVSGCDDERLVTRRDRWSRTLAVRPGGSVSRTVT